MKFLAMRTAPLVCGAIAACLLGLAPTAATAQTWYVDDDAPNDPGHGDPLNSDPEEDGSAEHPYDAIQEAMDAASDADTVIVKDGTYTGDGNRDIDFEGKAVHVRSENGPGDCVIDAGGSEEDRHRGFYLHSDEDEGSVIDGFTITNGNMCHAGGICCSSSSPTITNNIITGNAARDDGGGIYCCCSLPTITNNTITANRAGDDGAGIYSYNSTPAITNCILWNIGDDLYGCSATYSCIKDGDQGTGNISAYPHFVDPINGDYHLRSYSPCIDAGDDTAAGDAGHDIDGEPRIMLAHIDMGADESPVRSPDADRDGLPDDWETEHFGHTWSGPADDPDGDELTNEEEYELGTDPNRDARTIYVRAANAGDPLADGSLAHPYASIQEGIDAAGETVCVAEGTYAEALIIDEKPLDIQGGYSGDFSECDRGVHTTTIDARGGGSAVWFYGVSAGCLSGFSITGGSAIRGGAVYCTQSSPAITNCTITGNTGVWEGGGIWCLDSSPAITGNTITGNTASFGGGGIYCCYSSPTITGNTITGNTASSGGGIYCNYSCPTIANNTITGNMTWHSGAGIYCDDSSPTIANNTITGNSSRGLAGGIYCEESSPTITNSILWHNAAAGGRGSGIYLMRSTLMVRYSDISGGAGGAYVDPKSTLDLDATNTHADPFFSDPGHWDESGTPDDTSDDVWLNGDYHLRSQHGRWNPTADAGAGGWVFDDVSSPCIDGGDPESDYSKEPKPNGDRLNMGAHGGTPEASKSLFRLHVSSQPFTGVSVTGDAPGLTSYGALASYSGEVVAVAAPEVALFNGVEYDFVRWVLDSVDCGEGQTQLQVRMDRSHSAVAVYQKLLFVDDDAPNDPGPGDPSVSDPAEDGSQEHPYDAIQEALDPAGYGYIIVVRDGVYTGDGNRDLDFGGEGIQLRSQNGADGCVVDCQGGSSDPHRGFYFHTGEDRTAIVDGFTITGGYSTATKPRHGAGICCDGASPTIINCVIAGNSTSPSDCGGGIYCSECSPAIISTTLTSNAASLGAGIYCNQSDPEIVRCTISENKASWGGFRGDGIYCDGGEPVIINSLIAGNEDSAICGPGPVAVVNCTIADNGTSGIERWASSEPVTVINCVLWNNGDDLKYCTAAYSCIEDGDPGEGNIAAYPYFADPEHGDYHLEPWSPCIDAGDDSAALPHVEDRDGSPRNQLGGVDMGCYEAPAKSADDDEDGLPDEWEITHFGNTEPDPADDPDKDGITNLEEYKRNTTPNSDAVYVSAANAGDPQADGSLEHPFGTIQEGVDTAGDVVFVAGGTYLEAVLVTEPKHIFGGFRADFSERDAGTHATVVDAGGKETAVEFVDVPSGALDGFVITGAFGKSGAVRCSRSAPAITNNTLTGNKVGNEGGVVRSVHASSPVVGWNRIIDNPTTAVHARGGSLTLVNNLIARNSGVAVRAWGAECTILGNTIVDNLRGGIENRLGALSIANCILWDNGDELMSCEATYCCIEDGDEGEGNISLHPHFADRLNGDYRLRSYSPCIDAGGTALVAEDQQTDLDGGPRVLLGGVDMGAYESPVCSPDADNGGSGDGLPDEWELAYFDDTVPGPDDDPDGDGLTNRREYESGTHPLLNQTTVYVDVANADDPLADGTLDHPFPGIQQAVCIPTATTVLVAGGAYEEEVLVDTDLSISGGYNSDFTRQDAAQQPSVVTRFTVAAGNAPTLTRFTTGGVYVRDASPLIAENCIQSVDGTSSSIYCYGGSPEIRENVLTGARISISWDTSAVIAANTITQQDRDCAIRADRATVTIVGNAITANRLSWGYSGIIRLHVSSGAITANTIAANNLSNGAAVIFCDESSPDLTGNLIVGNRLNDGAVVVSDLHASVVAAGNTIANNRLDASSAAVKCRAFSSAEVVNSILWNVGEGSELGSSNITVSYSNVRGGPQAADPAVTWGPGNIDADPLFAGPGCWDDNGTPDDPDDDVWIDGDYHLKSRFGRWDPAANAGEGGWVYDSVTSPCIDGGDPESDYSNEPMPNFGRVNMGAYGNTPQASKSSSNLAGDANNDCKVNITDMIFIRNRMNRDPMTEDNWRADVNSDGMINILDLMTVRNNLNRRCE